MTVANVSDKAYSDEELTPRWGVETPGFELQDVPQFWGLIAPKLENAVNLSTVRAPQLYLPGYGGSGVLSAAIPTQENLPAHDGLVNVMAGIFDPLSSDDHADYSGGTNMAMYQRW